MVVNVDANVELAYLTAGGGPAHNYVPGSIRVEGNFTYYCPRFPMRIVQMQTERDEWEAAVSWSLSLEEV